MRGEPVARLAAALASGVALSLSFPNHDLWYLAPVSVAILALATCGVRARFGALLGFVAGMAGFLPTLSWAAAYLSALPWVALSAVESLYVAAMAAVVAALQAGRGGRPHRVRPGVVVAAWMAQEFARSRTPYGGFPWARLAFSQADGPLARYAVLAGAPGVTFAVALLGGLLAAVVHRMRSRPTTGSARSVGLARVGGRRVLYPAVGAVVLVVLAPVTPVATLAVIGRADIVAVQGDVPEPGLDFNAERRAVLDNHVRGTVAEADRRTREGLPPPDLVVWPENSSDIDPRRNADAAAAIAGAVRAIRAPVLVGTLSEQPRLENVSQLYLPGGTAPAQTYAKRHPAPFAEYIPNRAFWRIFSTEVDLLRHDFSAGDRVGIFQVPTRSVPPSSTGTMAVGDLICFEVAYDDLTADLVAAGAQVVVVQTNNATFGFTAESAQQLAISRIRAIETGRTIVHVSTVGLSGFVTPDGAVHEQTELFEPATRTRIVDLVTGQTPAQRLGEWPDRLALLVLTAAAAQALRSRRRSRTGIRRMG